MKRSKFMAIPTYLEACFPHPFAAQNVKRDNIRRIA
jgi:hypothetical protein